MVSLEQVRLLETKVAKAIDFVKRLSEENTLLRGKLDGYKSRIDELEVLVEHFKEDQSRIEAGIISALEKLNQFEDVMDPESSENEAGEEIKEAYSSTDTEGPEPDTGTELDSGNQVTLELDTEAESEQDVEDLDPDTSGNAELDIF